MDLPVENGTFRPQELRANLNLPATKYIPNPDTTSKNELAETMAQL
jgi:hypothetical protein